MRTYFGWRDNNGACRVYVVGDRYAAPLNLRLDWRNHSPDGFNWGYCGSGPAQLALAILADCMACKCDALLLHQEFKFKVIGGIRDHCWVLTAEQVREAIEEICQRRNYTFGQIMWRCGAPSVRLSER